MLAVMGDDQLALWFESRRAQWHDLARSIVGTRADADDVVQDAWLKATGAWDEAIRSPAAWMTRTVRNLALDQLRHRRIAERFAASGDVSPPDAPSVEDALAQRLEAAAALRRIVEALDRDEAAALLLHVVFDEDHATLAKRTGRTVGAMRVAMHRARRRVRDRSESIDRPDVERTFAICWQAISQCDATPLHRLLSPPAAQLVPGDTGPVRIALAQVAGRYVLALRQGDRTLCVLPVGPLVDDAVTID